MKLTFLNDFFDLQVEENQVKPLQSNYKVLPTKRKKGKKRTRKFKNLCKPIKLK